MNLSEEELIRAMRDAILQQDGVEAAGEFDAWVQHMKKEHPGQPLFMVMRRPMIRFHVSFGVEGEEETVVGDLDGATLHEPQAVPTEHQLKMKQLWERFRKTVDKNGFEHAPVMGEAGWEAFWKEAIEQREVFGLEDALAKIDVQWRERSGAEDPYKVLEGEIDSLKGKRQKSNYSRKTKAYWNEQLKGIEGL